MVRTTLKIVTNVFLHDRDADENGTFDEAGGIATLLVSEALAGDGGNGSSVSGKVSPDGSLVVFSSSAFDLVAGDTNSVADVFLWERQTGIITRINIGAGGVQADRASQVFVQPFGGGNRYIAFVSSATNLVPFDGNGAQDAFVLDRVTGIVSLVSAAADGTRLDSGGLNLPALGGAGAISDDGTRVSFGSSANNLAPGDPSGNNDAFVKTILGNVLTVTGAPQSAIFATEFTVTATGGSAGTVTFTATGACTTGGAGRDLDDQRYRKLRDLRERRCEHVGGRDRACAESGAGSSLDYQRPDQFGALATRST